MKCLIFEAGSLRIRTVFEKNKLHTVCQVSNPEENLLCKETEGAPSEQTLSVFVDAACVYGVCVCVCVCV